MWTFTTSVAEFETNAGPWLRADPIRNTLPLVIAGASRRGVPPEARFGWWAVDGTPSGVAMMTLPPAILVMANLPEAAANELFAQWPYEEPAGLSGPVPTIDTVTAGLAGTGRRPIRSMRQRLYRLDELHPPAGVTGHDRAATMADRELILEWTKAFVADVNGAPFPTAVVLHRLELGLFTLWIDNGRPVAMASSTDPDEGMSRVGAVYSPPEHRRRGYGSAVTAATTQRLLDRGVRHVVLLTDLANPTSNAIYQAIGYRSVADYAEYDLPTPSA